MRYSGISFFKCPRLNLLGSIISSVFGIILLMLLVHYLFRAEQLDTLALFNVWDFVVSTFFLIFCFALNGLQTRLALSSTGQAQLSAADVLALPITQNFWGHVIPFQGSFIYSAAFLKAKYNADVSITASIALFITFCSLTLGSLVGALYSLFQDPTMLPFYVLILLLPLWLVIFEKLFNYFQPKLPKLAGLYEIILQVLQSIIEMSRMPQLLAKVIFFDTCFVLTYASWSYYLSEVTELNIPFMIHLLTAFMMKLTLIFKLTPGNIGIVQAFTGGVFSMHGYPPEIGVLLSTIQLGLIMVISFPVAIVLSLFQFKYLRLFIKDQI